jgi:hypothetical protein
MDMFRESGSDATESSRDASRSVERPWCHENDLRMLFDETVTDAQWVEYSEGIVHHHILVPDTIAGTWRGTAKGDRHVIIFGERGTGKDYLAKLLVEHGRRSKEIFNRVNCACIPSDFAVSELAGHEKGSFTGATSNKDGWLLKLRGGTLLLDEVQGLELEGQGTLLRFLQSREVQKRGGTIEKDVDVRVIAATNVNPSEIRADFLDRFPEKILLPALRDKAPDAVCMLLHRCLSHSTKMVDMSIPWLAQLLCHEWPGNARELHTYCGNCLRALADARAENERLVPEPFVIDSGTSRLLFQLSERTTGYPIAETARRLLALYWQRHSWKIVCGNGEEPDLVVNSLRLLGVLQQGGQDQDYFYHPSVLPIRFLSNPQGLPRAYAGSVLGGYVSSQGPRTLVEMLYDIGVWCRRAIKARDTSVCVGGSGLLAPEYGFWIAMSTGSVPEYGEGWKARSSRADTLIQRLKDDGWPKGDIEVVRLWTTTEESQPQIGKVLSINKETVSERLRRVRDDGRYRDFVDLISTSGRRRRTITKEKK